MISVVNLIPSKSGSFPQVFWKVVLRTRLNVYRESSGDSWFVTNNLMVYFKWSETRSISCTNSIFPLNFIRVCAQYQFKTTSTVDGLRLRKYLNTNFMIKLKICQKQPFDIIAMTPRGTLGLCCVHIAQLMTHPAIYTLPFTLQLCYKPLGILQRVTKSQKAHISSHDGL